MHRRYLQFNALRADPVAIRSATGELGLEFFVGDQSALLKVDQEHAARLKPPLRFDDFGVDR